MREAGLRGRAARRWQKTTIAGPAAAARADKVRRDFTANATNLNARWCGDNALAESFFGSIKGELIDLRPGPPGPPHATPSPSTSAGTTAAACTAVWDTSAPPSSKPPAGRRSEM
jgi:transposase InsO family protein